MQPSRQKEPSPDQPLIEDVNSSSIDSESDNELTSSPFLRSTRTDRLTNQSTGNWSRDLSFLPNSDRASQSNVPLIIEDTSETDNDQSANHRSDHASRDLPQPTTDHMVSYNNPGIEETILIDNNVECEEEEKRDRTKDEMTRVYPAEHTVIENNVTKELASDDVTKELTGNDVTKDLTSNDVTKELASDDVTKELTGNDANPSASNYVNKYELQNDNKIKSMVVEDVTSEENVTYDDAMEHNATEHDTMEDDDMEHIYSDPDDRSDATLLRRASSSQYVYDQSDHESEREKVAFERANTRLYIHTLAEDRLSEVDNPDKHGEYNPMRNWVRTEDQGDGIIKYETKDGIVRFMMEMGFEYPNPPNTCKLSNGCELLDNPSVYLISSNCEFFIDNGIWKLQLESDLEDIVLRMDVGGGLNDSTAKPVWKLQLQSDIENIVRGYFIAEESVLDDSKDRWVFPNDSSYNPKSGHFIMKDDADFINIMNKASLGKCGEIVQTKTRCAIPNPHNSEFKDHKRYKLNKDMVLSNTDRGLTTFKDSEILQIKSKWSLCEEGDIDDQGSRHFICEGGELQEDKPIYSIFEDEILEDIKFRFLLSEDATLVDDTIQCLIPEEGILEDIRNHKIAEEQLGRLKSPDMLICDDIDIVDIAEFRIADLDIIENPAIFKLNQIEIDDEYLNDDDEDQ